MALESFLLADIGSATTKVALIDLVGEEHRLVASSYAPSTHLFPWNDVSLGLRRAIGEIGTLTGRTFFDGRGQLISPEALDGSGVDGFLATTSAMEPIRLLVVGLAKPASLECALRAVSPLYALVEGAMSVEDFRPPSEKGLDLLGILSRERVDAIVLCGGTDDGAIEPLTEIAKDLSLFLSWCEGRRPPVIFAGNEAARPQMTEILGGLVELQMVDNIIPRWGVENPAPLQGALEALLEGKVGQIPGMEGVQAWSSIPPIPTFKAFSWMVRFLAEKHGLRVAGVDLGSSSAGVVVAKAGGGSYFLTCQHGLGYGLNKLLAEVGVERIVRWLPVVMEKEQGLDRTLNMALRPNSLPQTHDDLFLELAVGRELLAWLQAGALRDEMAQVDLIIGSGGVLSRAPHPRMAATVLLDGLQPQGLLSLTLDRHSLLAQLGALATQEPLAAAEVLSRDGLLNLGSVVGVRGKDREGQQAVRFKATYERGEVLEGEVAFGSLEVIPVLAEERAAVELRPSPNFDVGLGKMGRGAITQAEGGVVGVVIDARGRPINLPESENEEARAERIERWMREIGL